MGASAPSEDIQWPGGYFGFPGSRAAAQTLGDHVRQEWRKEYLPGPTALAALSLCTVVAGLLLRDHKPISDCGSRCIASAWWVRSRCSSNAVSMSAPAFRRPSPRRRTPPRQKVDHWSRLWLPPDHSLGPGGVTGGVAHCHGGARSQFRVADDVVQSWVCDGDAGRATGKGGRSSGPSPVAGVL